MPTSDRDQRIMELSTGFALNELDDAELKEFYDLLREPGEAGVSAGQIAWETLGTMVDLRTQMGTSFQDTLYLKLSEGGQDDARFATKVRNRLGRSRPRLQPVESPEPPDARPSWALWIAGAALLALIAGALLWPRGEAAVARVVAVAGAASLDGRGVVAGQAITRRQILVPSGAQLTIGWTDGSEMTLAGPASAVAGSEGLSLLGGQAWWTAVGTLNIGLPDRTVALALPPGSRGALAIRDNRTTVALSSGQIASSGITLAAGHAVDLAQPDQSYPWQHEPLATGTSIATGGAAARWRITGNASWSDTTSAITVNARTASGDAVIIRLAPGSVVLTMGGKEKQRSTLSGAPLADRRFDITGDSTTLAVTVSSQRLELPLTQPIASVQCAIEAGAVLSDARFSTGPEQEPPLPRR